jgi:hypothetical protein
MLNKKQLEEVKEMLNELGMNMSDDELQKGYEEFVKDYERFKMEMLLGDVCLN